MIALWILVITTTAFSVLRFAVPVSGGVNPADIFKDLAHIWIGFLIGTAVAGWKQRKLEYMEDCRNRRIVTCLLVFVLTAVEIVAFMLRSN